MLIFLCPNNLQIKLLWYCDTACRFWSLVSIQIRNLTICSKSLYAKVKQDFVDYFRGVFVTLGVVPLGFNLWCCLRLDLHKQALHFSLKLKKKIQLNKSSVTLDIWNWGLLGRWVWVLKRKWVRLVFDLALDFIVKH